MNSLININKTYVINLDRRPDRLVTFYRKCPINKDEIEIFEAIDGAQLNYNDDVVRIIDGNDYCYRRGVAGCSLSHYLLWKKICQEGKTDENYIIFEDDVFFVRGFIDIWNNHIVKHWNNSFDVMFLGLSDKLNNYGKSFCNDQKITMAIGNYDNSQGGHGTFAYLLSYKGAQKLVAHAEKNKIQQAIDKYLQSLNGILDIKVVIPLLCYSPMNYQSDIQNTRESIQGFYKYKSNESNDLSILFVDFWPEFNPMCNFFVHLLEKYIDNRRKIVVIRDTISHPDIVIYSLFGNRSKRIGYPKSKKIFYTGECVPPDQNADLSITFDHNDNMVYNQLRVPLWMLYINWFNYPLSKIRNFKDPIPCQLKSFYNKDLDMIKKKNKFCAFICSNNACEVRNNFFHALSKYKKVDAIGRLFNNVDYILGGDQLDKLEYLQPYKFCIAFENRSNPGYCTEKILHAFSAGCIPLYWGDPMVDKDFNPNSFLNLHNSKCVKDFIDEIKRIDQDDDAWMKIYLQHCFTKSKKELQTYLKHIYNDIIKV